MTTTTRTAAKATSPVMAALLMALVGGTMVFLGGFAQSQTLHDAAHDVRHATGFPCH